MRRLLLPDHHIQLTTKGKSTAMEPILNVVGNMYYCDGSSVVITALKCKLHKF